jgi:hypothetical protein
VITGLPSGGTRDGAFTPGSLEVATRQAVLPKLVEILNNWFGRSSTVRGQRLLFETEFAGRTIKVETPDARRAGALQHADDPDPWLRPASTPSDRWMLAERRPPGAPRT